LPKKEKNISTEFSFTIQTDSVPIVLTFREVF
jgi:hypothetical protein